MTPYEDCGGWEEFVSRGGGAKECEDGGCRRKAPKDALVCIMLFLFTIILKMILAARQKRWGGGEEGGGKAKVKSKEEQRALNVLKLKFANYVD